MTVGRQHERAERISDATAQAHDRGEPDRVHDVPAGGVVRVAPETVRSLVNHSDEAHVRLAVGAPPVGSVDDFGSYVVEES